MDIFNPNILLAGLDMSAPELVSATCYVYLSDKATLAPLYADPDLTTTIANPVELGANSKLPLVYLASGHYRTELISGRTGDTLASLTFRSHTTIGSTFRMQFSTVHALLNDTTLSYSAGTDAIPVTPGDLITEAEINTVYEVIDATAPTPHLITENGVKLAVKPNQESALNIKSFGATGDGTTDDTFAIQTAIDTAAQLAQNNRMLSVIVPCGLYRHNELIVRGGVELRGKGGVLKLLDNIATDTQTSYFPMQDDNDGRAGFVDLILDGNSENNTDFLVCDCLTLSGRYSYAENIEIRNAPDSGVMFSDAEGAWLDSIRVIGARDVGIYVNGSEGTIDGAGGRIGRVWVYDCNITGVAFKRTSSRLQIDSIYAENCGNAVSFEDFGTNAGGAPSELIINAIQAFNIGFNQRSYNAAETLITMNAAANISVGSLIGRNISGTGININGCKNISFCSIDITGYTTDPLLEGDGNTGVVIGERNGVTSSGITILGGQLQGFAQDGLWIRDCRDSTLSFTNVGAEKNGLRIGDTVSRVTVNGLYQGQTGDLSRSVAATNTDLSKCIFEDRTGVIEQHGGQRSTAVISPIGIITPWYVGQLCDITTQSQRFIATGLSNTDWEALSEPYYTTEANITNLTHAVNTQGKYLGRVVWDITNSRMLRAAGQNPNNGWHALNDGTLVLPN